MSAERTEPAAQPLSRRDFLKTSATVTAAALASRLPLANYAHAAANETIRVGVIGCGGRGGGAAEQIVGAAPGVEIHALGDLFPERVNGLRGHLQDKVGDKIKVTDDRCFTGFDAYQKVINSDVDLVILATPPGFRPTHFKAAVDAGKHIFTEKPVAVCPAGVRMVLAAAEAAKQKGLGIVAGTQRRHQNSYRQCIQRLHDGAIGEIVAGQCYWNQGGLWVHQREAGWSDMEWQIRNWLYFTWLSGDHIVEQHVHNLDVINWVLQAHPVKCLGMGGRQSRTDPAFGHIYDHFTVEYEYPNGARVMSMCRQIDGCANRVDEFVIGTKGTAHPSGSIRGETAWSFRERGNDPYVQELTDLIVSIRDGQPLNEGQQVAESTLTAIMGRMSAYTGQEVTWDQALN
ncbi:MAG: Gfo/Idh/MocA family oxidoreductase, partial [Armatimonadetes bacterium]|nr:Gfo/Idh/MocA family oxidoreductase [Armatimonadota bacterium]